VVFLKDGVMPRDAAIAGDGVDVAKIHERLRELGI
jgi:hypothetical protein